MEETKPTLALLTELKFYIPLDTETGYFQDNFPSQSHGMVLKKLKVNAGDLWHSD